MRNPLPEAVTARQKNVDVVAGQLPWYRAMLGEVCVPVTRFLAFAYRKIIDDEAAVKRYQISSSGVAIQVVPGTEGVAFSVEADTEVEQAVPNGVVAIIVALVHSSFTGACALVFTTAILVNNSISKILVYIVPGFLKSYFFSEIFCSS
jgi:hypothetical protein